MNDQFPPFDSYQGFGDVEGGYKPTMPFPPDPYVVPPLPHPPYPGPVIPIQLKDLMRYVGDVNRLPQKPDSHTMPKYPEYGNRIVQYGDVVRCNGQFYLYGYNKEKSELEWINFNGSVADIIEELSANQKAIKEVLFNQTYRKSQTSSDTQLSIKFNSLSNDFALKSELTSYATKVSVDALESRVARNEIFVGSHEDRLCCHAKKIDQLASDVKCLSDNMSSYVTWDDFSSKTTSAEVSAIVEGYNFAKQSYVDEVVSQTSSNLSNDLTAQFDELVQGLASDADLKKLSVDVKKLSNDTNASIGELFNKNERRKIQIADLYRRVKNLDGLCAIIDADVNAINTDILSVKFDIESVKQSLDNYVKLSAFYELKQQVSDNTNSITCLQTALGMANLKIDQNAHDIADLKQDVDDFKQEVASDYAKNEYLTAYVQKSQFNAQSDLSGKVYAVQLSGVNSQAYVYVPWNDKFVDKAWYDTDTKTIWIEFNESSKLSVYVGDLVDVYTAGKGLLLSSGEFSVSADYVLRPEMYAALTDYYQKSETSSAEELSNEFTKYYQKTETSSASEINHELSTFYYKRAEIDNKLTGYYQKSETSSAEELSAGFADTSRVYITDQSLSVDDQLADLHIKKVNTEEFYSEDSKLSDTLYVLTGDVLRAYGMRITDVAEPEDAGDAANKQYVDSIAEEEKIRERAEVNAVSSDIVSQIEAVSSEITATIESTSSIITADISSLQDDRDYVSAWISSNFENTDKDAQTTVLKQEVRALSSLSAESNVYVKGSLFALDNIHNSGQCFRVQYLEGDDNVPKERSIVGEAELVNFNTPYAILDLNGNRIRLSTEYIELFGKVEVKSLSDIYAEDVSCSVADLCIGLSTDVSALSDELIKYKQSVKDCISEISTVNILTSSNIADIISSVIKLKDIVATLSAI